MFVMGLDIGYSNLKLAYGEQGGQPSTRVLPAGAGPIELMPRQLTGQQDSSCIQVVVDGEKWAAGVEPGRLQGWDRELHGDYPSTAAYRALFYAGLLLSERDEVDVLVTGLPVHQYMDESSRLALVQRLAGSHDITPKRRVMVKKVVVVPQPAGAYMELVSTSQDQELLGIVGEGRTVVIDPGFFSVDWVALDQGEVRYHSSGTSLKAMSMLLEEANRLIQEDHGAAPGIEKIEQAIRGQKSDVLLLGQRVALSAYLEQAAGRVAPHALTPMRTSMREDGLDADVVLLAGGGAAAYREAAQEIFSRSRVVMPEDSVTANARGFWFCG